MRLSAETIKEASQMAEDIWRERGDDDDAVAFCLVDSVSGRIVHFGGYSKPPSGKMSGDAKHNLLAFAELIMQFIRRHCNFRR